VDSLNSLQLPTERYKQKRDSILRKKDHLLAEVKEKQQTLFTNTRDNWEQWQSKLKTDIGLEKLNLPAADLPKLDLPSDLKVPSLQVGDFQKLNLSPDLSFINEKLSINLPDGLQEWKNKIGQLPDLKGITNNPNKAIENAVSNVDGVGEIKKKLDVNGLQDSELGKVMQSAQNPETLKQTAIEEVKKEAINHFAGKEQVLQSAMEQISKYKQKYESVGSLSEIQNLKRPPNPMKGKAFIERFVPGFALQIHTRNYLNFDINPNAFYKLNGRLNVGLGWNQRFAMDWATKTYKPEGRVFGPRTYLDIKLPRGFLIRQEFELLNSYIPPFSFISGETRREWVFSTMTGLKKDYKFFKRVKGFTIVQFDLVRLIKPSHNSPYADVVNTRLGFEFPMKKKKPKSVDK
jgi:hypothetical protein